MYVRYSSYTWCKIRSCQIVVKLISKLSIYHRCLSRVLKTFTIWFLRKWCLLISAIFCMEYWIVSAISLENCIFSAIKCMENWIVSAIKTTYLVRFLWYLYEQFILKFCNMQYYWKVKMLTLLRSCKSIIIFYTKCIESNVLLHFFPGNFRMVSTHCLHLNFSVFIKTIWINNIVLSCGYWFWWGLDMFWS